MKKKALLKTSLREIKNSPTRFLSIMGIIFLGVAFFVGIGATGPDMIKSADNYYQKQSLADAAVSSTLGLSNNDLKLIEEESAVYRAEAQYTVDLNLAAKNRVVRFVGFRDTDKLNDYKVVKGRLPQKSGEIALDHVAFLQEDYELGDKFIVANDDDPRQQIKTRELKVVGFVNSPEFIENLKRGNTNVGSGSVDYFAVIPQADLRLSAYSRILVKFRDAETQTAYSDAYEDTVTKDLNKLKKKLAKRPEIRLEEVKKSAEEELRVVHNQIDQLQGQLDAAEKKLAATKKEIETGKKQLTENQTAFSEEVLKTETEHNEEESLLNQQEQTLDTQEQNITLLKRQIAEAEHNNTLAEEAKTEEAKEIKELEEEISAAEKADKAYDELSQALQEAAESENPAEAAAKQKNDWMAAIKDLPEASSVTTQIEALTETATKEELESIAALVTSALTKVQEDKKTYEDELKALQDSSDGATLTTEQIAERKEQLAEAEDELTAGREAYEEALQTFETAKEDFEKQKVEQEKALQEAQEKLTKGEADYQKGTEDFQKQTGESMPKLMDAELQLKNEQTRLNSMKPADYIFSDRDDNPGYTEYKQNADRISSLATVFPIIFFLIAALVSLTTMSRMIEEKRLEIGTFKALGYKNHEIAQKFLFYSLCAGLIGAVLGLALGFYLFPSIIIKAYGQLYNIEDFVTPWYVSYSAIGIAVALICTVGIALLTLRIDLFSSPASLLRPKAPKAGKRVWLERIKPLWKNLNFIQKVTMRNLFRYKLRMLMTIFGIAGCTSMIVTGFGLRDSISDIVPMQFEKLYHYQAVVSFNDNATPTQTEKYQAEVVKLNRFKDKMDIAAETLTLSGNGETPQDVSVYVPQDLKKLPDFILLNDRVSGIKYKLDDKGAVINEKLASLFDLAVGDTIHLKAADKREYPIKIAAIAENYTGHFAYLSPNYYQKVFAEKPDYNAEFLLFDKDLSDKQEKKIANDLMENPKVINVTFLSESLHALDDTTSTLTIVVWVLIVSAGLLAFIVLYNLNNINISERIRELSTIKVLGFYDNEVTMYIYRENILLTIIGILLGLFLGKVEHDFVLKTVELDMLMFSPEIHWSSYLYSALITIFFTVVVGIVIYFKLKKVDMIEALKSNE